MTDDATAGDSGRPGAAWPLVVAGGWAAAYVFEVGRALALGIPLQIVEAGWTGAALGACALALIGWALGRRIGATRSFVASVAVALVGALAAGLVGGPPRSIWRSIAQPEFVLVADYGDRLVCAHRVPGGDDRLVILPADGALASAGFERSDSLLPASTLPPPAASTTTTGPAPPRVGQASLQDCRDAPAVVFEQGRAVLEGRAHSSTSEANRFASTGCALGSGGSGSSPDALYRLRLDAPGELRVQMKAAEHPAVAYILAESCVGGAEVACGTGVDPIQGLALGAGTHYLVVDGADSQGPGAFALELTLSAGRAPPAPRAAAAQAPVAHVGSDPPLTGQAGP